jgi:hypothetical protein
MAKSACEAQKNRRLRLRPPKVRFETVDGTSILPTTARRIDAVHAVSRAAPDVAVLVAADAVGVARGHGVEHPALSQCAGLVDIEYPNVPNRVVREQEAGLDDVETPLVRRKAQAVGPSVIVGHHAQRTRARVQPVDPRRLLLILPASS